MFQFLALAEMAYERAVALFENLGRNMINTVTDRLADHYGIPAGKTKWFYRSIALAAQKGMNVADFIMQSPGNILSAKSFPVTPDAERVGPGAYVYRVLVEATNQSGNVNKWAINVIDASPLGWQTIQNLAQQQVNNLAPALGPPVLGFTFQGPASFRFTLLTAGRAK